MSEWQVAPGGSPKNERGLTERQEEILSMHEQGMSQAAIAEKLEISKQAVYFVKKRLQELGFWS